MTQACASSAEALKIVKKKGKPQGKPFFFGIEKELDFQAAGRHRSVERAAVAAGIEPAAGFPLDTESIAW